MENETLEAQLARLSNADLLASLDRAVAKERGSSVAVLKHLNAVELRKALEDLLDKRDPIRRHERRVRRRERAANRP